MAVSSNFSSSDSLSRQAIEEAENLSDSSSEGGSGVPFGESDIALLEIAAGGFSGPEELPGSVAEKERDIAQIPFGENSPYGIPDVVLIKTFRWLSKEDKVVACLVCREWRGLVIASERESRTDMIGRYFQFFLGGEWPLMSGVSFAQQKKQLSLIKQEISSAKTLKDMRPEVEIRTDIRKVFMGIDPRVLAKIGQEAKRVCDWVEKIKDFQELNKEITEAEEMDPGAKQSYSLSGIVAKLVPKDMQWGLDLIPKIPDIIHERPYAACMIAKQFATRGQVDIALDFLGNVPDTSYYKTNTLCEIVKELIQKGDISGARSASNMVVDLHEKTQVKLSIIKVLLKMGNVEEALVETYRIPDKKEQPEAFFQIIQKLVEEKKQKDALEVVVKAFEEVMKIEDESFRNRMLYRVLKECIQLEDSETMSWEIVDAINNKEGWKDTAFSTIAKNIAEMKDADRRMQVLTAIPELHKSKILSKAAEYLIKLGDKKSAREILSIIPSRSTRLVGFFHTLFANGE